MRADRGQSEILPLIPPSPRAGFACFITDRFLSFTFSVFPFDIAFPLGGRWTKQSFGRMRGSRTKIKQFFPPKPPYNHPYSRLPLEGKGFLRNKAVKKSFLFLFEKSPRKIFSNKRAVYKRTTAQKRTARQSIAPVYQALSPLFMVNGTGIYHKRPVHLFAQHHTHQLMRQSHIRKRKLKIRRPFHLRRQPARRAD